MRHGVDAAREPRRDHEAGSADLAGELPCELGAGSRALSRADDSDGRPLQQADVALHVEHRRRCIERGERRRVLRFTDK
jgi:hypothetical protein